METIILEEWDGNKEIAIRETKDQLYYYRYNDRIYVVQKVKEEKKEMTEWEKQKKELDREKEGQSDPEGNGGDKEGLYLRDYIREHYSSEGIRPEAGTVENLHERDLPWRRGLQKYHL